MPKVNFSLDAEVRDELARLVPTRQRSRVVNELLREGLSRMKRGQALQQMLRLRKRTAKLTGEEIVNAVRRDRARG